MTVRWKNVPVPPGSWLDLQDPHTGLYVRVYYDTGADTKPAFVTVSMTTKKPRKPKK